MSVRSRHKSIAGFSSLEGIILLSLVAIAMVLLVSKSQLVEKAKSDDILFIAASSLASGVVFARQQWKNNGHKDGDAVDDLLGFRAKNMNMTFNGWPRSTTGPDNHTHMTVKSCTEVWQGLVEDRWQDTFITNAESGSLGVCRYYSTDSDGYVEYDVKRGRVVLTIG